MGYNEAKEDGIRIVSSNNYTAYYPKCHICGEETKVMAYIRGTKYTCKQCKLKNYMADKELRVTINKDKKEQKFENAIKRIEKNVGKNIKKYDRAIEIVHKNLHKERWFESTEEIMTAIELIKNGLKVRHQVKAGIYRIDFVLEDEKIILEIDGKMFHTEKTKEKEFARDNILLLKFGTDWEVIRITDDYINQNIKRLVPAIRKVRDERQRVRKLNDGILPDWYTEKSF